MTTPFAYVHFGGAGTVDNLGPRLTIRAPLRVTETPRAGRTVSGYGCKLPTPYMVQVHGRWRRVYVCQYGNAGTAYIGKPGAWLATVDHA